MRTSKEVGLAPATLHHPTLRAGLVAAASVVVAGIFFFRARGAAVNFVREVYRAKDALGLGLQAPERQPPPRPKASPPSTVGRAPQDGEEREPPDGGRSAGLGPRPAA